MNSKNSQSRQQKVFKQSTFHFTFIPKKIMFNLIVIIISVGFVLAGCNQKGKYYPSGKKDTSGRASSKMDSASHGVKKTETGFNEKDLQLFCNNEIAPYCVLLPLNEFREEFNNQSVARAQHKF